MEVNELFRANKRESAVDLVVNNIKQLLIEKKTETRRPAPQRTGNLRRHECEPRIRAGSHENTVCFWTGGY